MSEEPEDDLATIEDARIFGTCEWLSTKNSYLKWKDFATDAPSVLWANRKPVTGKSEVFGDEGAGGGWAIG